MAFYIATFVLLGHDINDAIAQAKTKHATKRRIIHFTSIPVE